MPSFQITPDVTFDDTNVVGNVYFANFLRWHDDCFFAWLKGYRPAWYGDVFGGSQRVVVKESKTRYHDSVGATVGDRLKVEMKINDLQAGEFCMEFTTGRFDGTEWTPLATESRRLAIVEDQFSRQASSHTSNTDGLAFVAEFPHLWRHIDRNRRMQVSDLIRLQGKCRERFLQKHAVKTLRAVASQELALQTSQATYVADQDIEVGPADSLRIRMRLTHLRGGRLSVEFEYSVLSGLNGSRTAHRIGVGTQSLCSKRVTDHGLVPAVFPEDMLRGLKLFVDAPQLQKCVDDTLEYVMLDQHDARLYGCVKPSNNSRVAGVGIR